MKENRDLDVIWETLTMQSYAELYRLDILNLSTDELQSIVECVVLEVDHGDSRIVALKHFQGRLREQMRIKRREFRSEHNWDRFICFCQTGIYL